MSSGRTWPALPAPALLAATLPAPALPNGRVRGTTGGGGVMGGGRPRVHPLPGIRTPASGRRITSRPGVRVLVNPLPVCGPDGARVPGGLIGTAGLCVGNMAGPNLLGSLAARPSTLSAPVPALSTPAPFLAAPAPALAPPVPLLAAATPTRLGTNVRGPNSELLIRSVTQRPCGLFGGAPKALPMAL